MRSRVVGAVVTAGLVGAVLGPVRPAAALPEACADAPQAALADRASISAVHLDAVDCLVHLGIAQGRADGEGGTVFAPAEAVDRGQFTAMLRGVLTATGDGERLTQRREPRFEDVPEDHPFDAAIHELAAVGVVEGVTASEFVSWRNLRRDQAASLLHRAAGWSTGRDLSPAAGPYFADTGGVHGTAIDAGFEYGLVDGTRYPCEDGRGRYSPLGGLQRQQAASMLVRAIEAIEAIEAGASGDRRGEAECPSPVWLPDLDAAIAYANGRSGSVSFAAIGTDGAMVGHRAATTVPIASVLKVMFLVAYLDEPDVRDRALTQSDRDLLEPMIRSSANDPATQIANKVGPASMNALAERAGMRDFAYTRPWGATRTSARDQVAFMLAVDDHIPQRHRAYALDLLTRVHSSQRWGVGQVATPNWIQHFKGGWGSGTGAVDHQVVMLEHADGTRVALAVMTTSSPDHTYGKQTLEGVFSRLLSDLPRE
ncbi:MAG TPA: serine hydrolase [Egicoccus sp.]|nr:serine hydrolase [Egicoccus sp.]HSK24648.1 serine hydrolase [Egicoccus sp.]